MNKIYLLAIAVATFTIGLYVPKMVTYAQDKAEQRKINEQILDLQLELADTQMERDLLDSDKLDYIGQIELMSGYVQDIQEEQNRLHERADQIRKEIDILKGDGTLNDKIVNCYEYTGDLYNECLDAIIQVGLQQRRQPQ